MRLDRRRLLATGLLLALGGCATPRGVVLVAGTRGETAALEPLKKVSADSNGLTIEVVSNGCTRREDFVFYLDRLGGEPAIAFARKRLDACHGPSSTVVLAFAYAELGLAPRGRLWVLNPAG
jgi:hypothetical protein